jgi:hypothetical protein
VKTELLVKFTILSVRAEQVRFILLIDSSDIGDVQVALFWVVPLLDAVNERSSYFSFLLQTVKSISSVMVSNLKRFYLRVNIGNETQ